MALPPQPIVTSLLQKILSEQAMNLPGVQFLEEFRPTTTQEKPMKKKRIQLQLDEELAGELRSVLDLHKLTWDQWGAQAARVFVQDGQQGAWPDKNVLESAADVRIFDDRVDENGFAKVQFQVNPDVYLRLRDELAKSGTTWDQWGKEAIEACFSPSILYLADPTSSAPEVDVYLPSTSGFQIRFDGPPGKDPGRFVEVEDLNGRGLGLGEWRQDCRDWLLIFRSGLSSRVVELIMGIFKRWGQRQGPVWDAINAGEPQRRRYIEQLLAGEASLDPPPKPPRTRAKAWVDYSEDA